MEKLQELASISSKNAMKLPVSGGRSSIQRAENQYQSAIAAYLKINFAKKAQTLILRPERWQSGRMRRSWKPLTVTGPGVRIPLSPPVSIQKDTKRCKIKVLQRFLFCGYTKQSQQFLFLQWPIRWPVSKIIKQVTGNRWNTGSANSSAFEHLVCRQARK